MFLYGESTTTFFGPTLGALKPSQVFPFLDPIFSLGSYLPLGSVCFAQNMEWGPPTHHSLSGCLKHLPVQFFQGNFTTLLLFDLKVGFPPNGTIDKIGQPGRTPLDPLVFFFSRRLQNSFRPWLSPSFFPTVFLVKLLAPCVDTRHFFPKKVFLKTPPFPSSCCPFDILGCKETQNLVPPVYFYICTVLLVYWSTSHFPVFPFPLWCLIAAGYRQIFSPKLFPMSFFGSTLDGVGFFTGITGQPLSGAI